MSRLTLGSNDLLEYNSDYGVLICRDCEYAIQKSAVQSHLLRHKIYRGERQNLLSSIAQLQLYEPDDVSLPTPDTRPIAALPILDGYRCLQSGCTNLCASVKRMRRHWADVHGGIQDSVTMSREVKMQTFFRGTKIRYFEVSPSLAVQMADSDEISDEEELLDESEDIMSEADDDDSVNESDHGDEDDEMEDTDNTTLVPTMISPNFDLEVLKIFHRFVSITSYTLPGPSFEVGPLCYWENTVLPLAFSRQWLMSGVLAISEYHASVLTNDETLAEAHREQALSFFSDFLSGREEASRRVGGAMYSPGKEEERRVGGQLVCILRCAQWALVTNPLLGKSFLSFPFKLLNFATALRSFTLVERSGSDGTPEEVFARASRIFKERQSELQNQEAVSLLDRLDRLPSRMSDVFGRPNEVKDVMATLTAIASLVEHYGATFETEDGVSDSTAVWHSMVQWLSKVPDHFRYLISRNDPSALVVIVFWISALVLPAERNGYWFLSGLSKKLNLEIGGYFRESCPDALLLVEGLISEDFVVTTVM